MFKLMFRKQSTPPSQPRSSAQPGGQLGTTLGLRIKIGLSLPAPKDHFVRSRNLYYTSWTTFVFHVVSRITGLCSSLLKNNVLKIITCPRLREARKGLLCMLMWIAEDQRGHRHREQREGIPRWNSETVIQEILA